MERYAHKPVYKEPHQQNLWQILPAENHTASYDSWEKSNLGTKSRDKEALDNFTATKAEVATELDNWVDRETSCGRGRPHASWNQRGTDGSATVVPNLAEQAGNSHVANVVHESSDLWQQVEKQFGPRPLMLLRTIQNQLKQFPCLPILGSPCLPILGKGIVQVTVKGATMLKVKEMLEVTMATRPWERVGKTRAFHEIAALSRARWMPKYISHPQSNAQNTGVSKWTWDSPEAISDIDNSQGFDSTILDSRGHKLSQKVDRDGEMDLHSGQVKVDMRFEDENIVIWNQRDWEYQQLNPVPHQHGQHDGGYHRGRCKYWERGRDAGEPTYGANEETKGRHDFLMLPLTSSVTPREPMMIGARNIQLLQEKQHSGSASTTFSC